MGFCVLGIGACTQKQTTNNVQSIQRDNITNFLSKTINDITTDITKTAINSLTLDVEGGSSAIIHGITISQKATSSGKVSANLADKLTSSSFLDNVGDFIGKQGLSAKNYDKRGIFSSGTTESLTNTEAYVVDTIKTNLQNQVKNTDTKKILSSTENQVTLYAKSLKGPAEASDVHINQIASNATDLIVKNYVDAIQSTQLSQKIVDQLQQEASVVTEHTDPISDIFSNITTIIIGILAVVILFILYLIFRERSSEVNKGSSQVIRKSKRSKKTNKT